MTGRGPWLGWRVLLFPACRITSRNVEVADSGSFSAMKTTGLTFRCSRMERANRGPDLGVLPHAEPRSRERGAAGREEVFPGLRGNASLVYPPR